MAKRLFDIIAAAFGLAVLSPLLLITAALIKLTSPGPVFYYACRAGLGGQPFQMIKFRSMHYRPTAAGPAITRPADPRVFAVGRWIRALKIDELPQLINVLKGDMSIIGPRPEDYLLARRHYTKAWQRETLDVRPGLAGPGAIFHYTQGDECIDPADPDGSYVRDFLPTKLALERVYVDHASLVYDLRLMLRTLYVIAAIAMGRREFPDPPEMAEARRWIYGDGDSASETSRDRCARG